MQRLIDYINNFTKSTKEIAFINLPNNSKKEQKIEEIFKNNEITLEEFDELALFFCNHDISKMLAALDSCQTFGMDPSGINSKIYFLSVCSNVQNLKDVSWQDIVDLKTIYDKFQKEKQLQTAETKTYQGKSK